MDDYFLWGTDAAIVVDRRGTGDIVTSCGGNIPFCNQAYGEFFEKIAKDEGLSGWKCTPGGSSDTRVWAEHTFKVSTFQLVTMMNIRIWNAWM